MLRIHFMQQRFSLSDPAMEEPLHDVPLLREVGGVELEHVTARPDHNPAVPSTTGRAQAAPQILALVNELLGAKGLMLRAGTVLHATLIAAPRSSKDASGGRDPLKHTSRCQEHRAAAHAPANGSRTGNRRQYGAGLRAR